MNLSLIEVHSNNFSWLLVLSPPLVFAFREKPESFIEVLLTLEKLIVIITLPVASMNSSSTLTCNWVTYIVSSQTVFTVSVAPLFYRAVAHKVLCHFLHSSLSSAFTQPSPVLSSISRTFLQSFTSSCMLCCLQLWRYFPRTFLQHPRHVFFSSSGSLVPVKIHFK